MQFGGGGRIECIHFGIISVGADLLWFETDRFHRADPFYFGTLSHDLEFIPFAKGDARADFDHGVVFVQELGHGAVSFRLQLVGLFATGGSQ